MGYRRRPGISAPGAADDRPARAADLEPARPRLVAAQLPTRRVAARAGDAAVRRLAAAGAGTGGGTGYAGGVGDPDAARRRGGERLVLHHAAAPRGRLARAAGAAASAGHAGRAPGAAAIAAPGTDAEGAGPHDAAMARGAAAPLSRDRDRGAGGGRGRAACRAGRPDRAGRRGGGRVLVVGRHTGRLPVEDRGRPQPVLPRACAGSWAKPAATGIRARRRRAGPAGA